MSDHQAVLMQEVIVITGEEIPFATQASVLANDLFFSIDWSKNFGKFINANWTKEESKLEDIVLSITACLAFKTIYLITFKVKWERQNKVNKNCTVFH